MRVGSPTRSVAVLVGAIALVVAGCSASGEEGTSASSAPATTASAPVTTSTARSASAACSAGGDVTLDEIQLSVDGTLRTAMVHIPSGATGAEPLPVVLSFHGAGETAENRPVVDGFTALGDQHGFVSVYPQGLVGDAGPRSGVTGWDVEATAIDEPAFVAALLDEVGSRVCIDESRVYAAGISNGGAMALLLACALPERIAGVASVEGAVLEPGCGGDTPPVPVIAFHGLDDTVVPYAGSLSPEGGFPPVLDVMAARATINDCAGEPAVETVTPTIERRTWNGCQAAVVLYTLDDHGHAWPGHQLPVSQQDLASFIDPLMLAPGETADALAANLLLTNDHIDASELIWEFFHAAAR
ncbi:MAG TPA: PHB depolymerase family esterase [Ilumatobacteraceae bacterium]|nr:PHB depolymerase family esterase [Ilumatobacteraceae bacterium]